MKKVMILAACFAIGMRAHAQFAHLDSAQRRAMIEESIVGKATYPKYSFMVEEAYRKDFTNEEHANQFLQGKRNKAILEGFSMMEYPFQVDVPIQVGDSAKIQPLNGLDEAVRSYVVENIQQFERGYEMIEAKDNCANPVAFIVAPAQLDKKGKQWVSEMMIVQSLPGVIRVTACKHYQDAIVED